MVRQKSESVWKWLVFVGLTVLFSLQPLTDPDLGWHLMTGKYVVEKMQVPKSEVWTYSLPEHEYLAHSWLLDAVLFEVYRWWGLWGVNLVFAGLMVVVAGFLVLTSRVLVKERCWAYAIVLMVPLMVAFLGLRAQLVSLVGLAVLDYLLSGWGNNEGRLKKQRCVFLMPLLFWVWANNHAGFVVGWLYLGLWLGSRLIVEVKRELNRKKWFEVVRGWVKKEKVMLKTGVLAVAVTVLNPYGMSLYGFIANMVTRSMAVQLNTDWLPLLSPNFGSETLGVRLLVVVVAVAGVVAARGQIERKIMTGMFLLLTLKTARYALPLLVVMAPLAMMGLERMGVELKKEWRWMVKPVLMGVLMLLIVNAWPQVEKMVCANRSIECLAEIKGYPYGAIKYIKANDVGDNIFNHYTWGGFLMWQLPEHKVFIDGRMDNYLVGGEPFISQYSRLINAEAGWEEEFEKYDNEAVMLPSDWPLSLELKKMIGWQVVYEDNLAVILIKND